jgi:hypothetical protein
VARFLGLGAITPPALATGLPMATEPSPTDPSNARAMAKRSLIEGAVHGRVPEPYCAHIIDNLVGSLTLAQARAALAQTERGGGELVGQADAPPKLRAAYSSAALAVNVFAPIARTRGIRCDSPGSRVRLAGFRGQVSDRVEGQPTEPLSLRGRGWSRRGHRSQVQRVPRREPVGLSQAMTRASMSWRTRHGGSSTSGRKLTGSVSQRSMPDNSSATTSGYDELPTEAQSIQRRCTPVLGAGQRRSRHGLPGTPTRG